jgi:hypothetical protein
MPMNRLCEGFQKSLPCSFCCRRLTSLRHIRVLPNIRLSLHWSCVLILRKSASRFAFWVTMRERSSVYILESVISRVDRNAPRYDGYTDFNTSYIQTAMSSSGGSSGSPVVNIDGFAVALHAGRRHDSAANFSLPLDRVKKALECLQEGKDITRGTIQTQWLLKPYDEC